MATMTKSSVPGTTGLARKMFVRGTNFFSYDEIAMAFGPDAIPGIAQDVPLPTEEEMCRAKELGQRLILCGPITMEWMHDRLGNELGGGKLLYDIDWYKDEAFYRKVVMADWHWRFTAEGVIEDSLDENYLAQTRLLATYLKEQVYDGEPLPKLYADAIEEFKRCEESLAKLLGEDWKKATEQLASLQLNQLCRETPDHVLWETTLNYAANGAYSLPMYTWTNQRSSSGRLVAVGYAGSDGVGVGRGDPGRSFALLGVRFSRRVQDLAV